MHIAAATIVLLAISCVGANVVPKKASEVIQFPKAKESAHGFPCTRGTTHGICLKMGECDDQLHGRKEDTDTCLNVKTDVVVCCVSPKKTHRVEDLVENFTHLNEGTAAV